MAQKHEQNTYLYENDLNDQFSTFDLILTYKLPAEEDLQLYQIVVYEVEGVLVVHRIVGIEEPNASHPNERHFLCQGDAVETPDRFPVRYSQMRAIYKGQHIAFIGSFVTFMQSPAGWLCALLIVAALIGTPILEKKVTREKHLRLIAIGFLNADGTLYVPPAPFAHLEGKRNTRTFEQALAQASEEMRARHNEIVDTLSRFEGIRVIEGKTRRTYKCGNKPIARLCFKGKTLCVFLALSPTEYENTKYIFEDCSGSREYKLYPMKMKQSSDRQTRWTVELLTALAEKNGIKLLDKPVEILPEAETETEVAVVTDPFAHLQGKENNLTFRQRLEIAGQTVQARHDRIEALLRRFANMRVIVATKQETYKCGNTPVARMTVRGKTLNVYLALPCAEFAESKYVFTDASDSKKFALYPMRMRVTSERQTRHVCELLTELAKRLGIAIREVEPEPPLPTEIDSELSIEPDVTPASLFAHLEGKTDTRTFAQRLADLREDAAARYHSIVAFLNGIKGIRMIEGRRQQTFKCGNLPIARLLIRGKTLNVYLALDPKKFENTKYVFTDVSASKKFALYPMRMRISSERQRRWAVELLKAWLAEHSIEHV